MYHHPWRGFDFRVTYDNFDDNKWNNFHIKLTVQVVNDRDRQGSNIEG
jgi:hypothetical protein